MPTAERKTETEIQKNDMCLLRCLFVLSKGGACTLRLRAVYVLSTFRVRSVYGLRRHPGAAHPHPELPKRTHSCTSIYVPSTFRLHSIANSCVPLTCSDCATACVPLQTPTYASPTYAYITNRNPYELNGSRMLFAAHLHFSYVPSTFRPRSLYVPLRVRSVYVPNMPPKWVTHTYLNQ